LIAAVGGVATVIHGQLTQIAQQQIVAMAQVMLETARASRKYTTEQVAPLLDRVQTSGEQFHPQSIRSTQLLKPLIISGKLILYSLTKRPPLIPRILEIGQSIGKQTL